MQKICGLVACIGLRISSAHALEPGFGVKAGTPGAGIDLSVALKDHKCTDKRDTG